MEFEDWLFISRYGYAIANRTCEDSDPLKALPIEQIKSSSLRVVVNTNGHMIGQALKAKLRPCLSGLVSVDQLYADIRRGGYWERSHTATGNRRNLLDHSAYSAKENVFENLLVETFLNSGQVISACLVRPMHLMKL